VRNIVKTLLGVVLSSVVLSTVASAADLPVKAFPRAPYEADRWIGFYAGINGGWGDPQGIDISATNSGTGGGNNFGPKLRSTLTNAIPAGADTNPKGAIFGGQVGYNWRIAPMWLAGIETDIQWSDINGSAQASGSARASGPTMSATATVNANQEMPWFGTLRGRLGFNAMPNLLVYGTGGLAYGHVASSTSITEQCFNVCSPVPRNSFGTASDTRVGWAAGAGVEWAIDNRWSVKGEYLYVDLGDLSYSNTSMRINGSQSIVNTTSTAHFQNNRGRVGVNMKF